jgi:hypothetical protein
MRRSSAGSMFFSPQRARAADAGTRTLATAGRVTKITTIKTT